MRVGRRVGAGSSDGRSVGSGVELGTSVVAGTGTALGEGKGTVVALICGVLLGRVGIGAVVAVGGSAVGRLLPCTTKAPRPSSSKRPSANQTQRRSIEGGVGLGLPACDGSTVV